ncbi:hypothetical protein [Nocardia sp. NPDC052566]|uniref:hypothetical protein n=1 Tax=Nocardia sp. NPDC052566 TaxID=3364330 RepID=UPI0037C57735
MFDQLTIGSWVVVGEHCAVRRAPQHRDDYLTFVFEGADGDFEFVLHPTMLHKMLALTTTPPPDDPD